jgi:fatty-acyl-CoA synthase
VTDPDFGQRLRAYVVLDDGRPKLTADEIADYVRSNLARFKVPREVIFIERLPRNPAGKIVKHQLPPD